MHNIDIYIYVYGRTWLLEAPPSQDAKLRDLLKVDDIRKLAVTALSLRAQLHFPGMKS